MKKERFYDYPRMNEIATLKGTNLSVYARKTFEYIYREGLKIYEHKLDGGIFELNINDIKKHIGMKDTRHDVLVQELKAINKLEFETFDKKRFTSFPILAGFSLKEGSTIVEVALSPFLIREIFNKSSPYYHMTNLLDFKELKSKYSNGILNLIKRYKNYMPLFEVEELKSILDIPEGYDYSKIKEKVLEQAKKELFKYNNILLEWEFQNITKKRSHIKLSYTEMFYPTTTKQEFEESTLKAIEKVKRNNFVRFSIKSVEKAIIQYNENTVRKALLEIYHYNKEIKSFTALLNAKCKDIKESETLRKTEKNQPYESYLNEFEKSETVVTTNETVKNEMTKEEYQEFEDFKSEVLKLVDEKFNLGTIEHITTKMMIEKSNSYDQINKLVLEFNLNEK